MTIEARDSGGPAKTNTATARLVIKWDIVFFFSAQMIFFIFKILRQ